MKNVRTVLAVFFIAVLSLCGILRAEPKLENISPSHGTITFDDAPLLDWTDVPQAHGGLRLRGRGDHVRIKGDFGVRQFSVSLWCRPEALDVNKDRNDFRNLVASNGQTFLLLEEAGAISFRVPGIRSSNFRAGNVAVGEWTLVTVTYDGSRKTVYKNGEKVGQQHIGSGPVDVSDLTLSSPNARHSFDGILSGVRVYDRPLKPREVRAIFRGRRVQRGLTGWWKLTGDEAPTVPDASGNGHAGVLIDAKGPIGSEETWVPARGEQYVVKVDGQRIGTSPVSRYRPESLPEGTHRWQVLLEDAEGNTVAESETRSFAVERWDASAPALRFAVISDPHSHFDQTSRCIRDLRKNPDVPPVDMVFGTGDLFCSGGEDQGADEIGVRRMMTGKGAPYGWNDLLLPYFVLWGNHDTTCYGTHPKQPYSVPTAARECGLSVPFYSFEYDNILFLVVSSALGDCELLCQPQRDWLRQMTSMYPDKTTIILTHRTLHGSNGSSTQREYQYFTDTYSWWKDFLQDNPQILLYLHGHTASGVPFVSRKFGVHVAKCAMMAHGDREQMSVVEINEQGIRMRYWDAKEDAWVRTLLSEPRDLGYVPDGYEWFGTPHVAQDGEHLRWHNWMLAEGYKLQLIGEGQEASELVWMNRDFAMFDDPRGAPAHCLWVGYEEDWNNGITPEEKRDPAGYASEGHVTFHGRDTFAAATQPEDLYNKQGEPFDFAPKHVGGHIPWSTTPWVMPGKTYRLRVRMKAEEPVENAMDVSVAVLDRRDISHQILHQRVLKNVDLTESYRWYEGTFTVPENPHAWFAKTTWESKAAGATCYLDEWSVRRADQTGTTTEDFAVTLNGTRHAAEGRLPEGQMREFHISPQEIQNELDMQVAIGGNRVGMFRIVYENPLLWSDDASIGVRRVRGGACQCRLQMVSQFSPRTACLTPLADGVEVAGGQPVSFKNDYFTAWLLNIADLPRSIEVTLPKGSQ